MSAKIVLQYHLERFKTMALTLTDISFENLSFLTAGEKITNDLGEWVSKSYYDLKGREAVKIIYSKVFKTYVYNGISYENVFVGLKKSFLFMNWSGEVAYSKNKPIEYFTLSSVEDSSGKIIGFSSPKVRNLLRAELKTAKDIKDIRDGIL